MIFEFFKKKELHGARAPKRVSDHKPLKYERGLLDVFERKKDLQRRCLWCRFVK
jgi:hypothetical protein